MTPREVIAAIKATNWRYKYEHNERAWLAWWTAAMVRTKTMPTLQHLIDPPRTRVLSENEAADYRKHHKAAIDALPERFKKNLDDKG